MVILLSFTSRLAWRRDQIVGVSPLPENAATHYATRDSRYIYKFANATYQALMNLMVTLSVQATGFHVDRLPESAPIAGPCECERALLRPPLHRRRAVRRCTDD